MNANTQKSKSCSLKATRLSRYRCILCILEYNTAPQDKRTGKRRKTRTTGATGVGELFCCGALLHSSMNSNIHLLCLSLFVFVSFTFVVMPQLYLFIFLLLFTCWAPTVKRMKHCYLNALWYWPNEHIFYLTWKYWFIQHQQSDNHAWHTSSMHSASERRLNWCTILSTIPRCLSSSQRSSTMTKGLNMEPDANVTDLC